MIGRSVGKYRILDRVGRGGMGTVYRAIDETLQREVAIKVLNADVTEPESLKRFRAEAITLARLQHPAIATLFELTEDDGDLLMVMEFVRGETLQKLAERMGPMPPDFAAQLCSQALDGLWHAHRAGIVHRDLKPGNLMVTGDGIVKVMDFGIARIAGSEHLTSDGFTMGTPAYMAPEQVRGEEVDARSDIYAMGVVLYRLWTGRLPFQGETPFAIAHRQLNEAPTPLKVAKPDLPSWCDIVLARALAKTPSERYQTTLEFTNALATAATFMSLDDVATMTLRTPRAVVLPTFSGPLSGAAPMPNQASESARVASGSTAARAAAVGEDAIATPRLVPADAPATSSSPKTQGTVVISSRQMFAGVGALMVVLVVLAVGVVLAVKRMQQQAPLASDASATVATAPIAAQPEPSPSPDNAGAAAPAIPPDPSAPPVPTATQSTAPSTPATASKSAGASAAKTTPAGSTNPSVAAQGPKVSAGTPPPAPAATPPAPPSAVLPPAPADTLPAVAFDKLKLLVVDGDKAREADASLRFADGKVSIFGSSDKLVGSFPYRSVRTVTSSRSKQPRWRDANGTVAEAKLSGGAFGFLKGDRNWIGFVTGTTAYVLRVEDGDLQKLTQTVVQRTGAPLVRLADK
jgi:serine/threonine-protein kinase